MKVLNDFSCSKCAAEYVDILIESNDKFECTVCGNICDRLFNKMQFKGSFKGSHNQEYGRNAK